MKRTIALVLSLIFLLALVPATALADNDADAKLVIEIPDATKTLFDYVSDKFNWDSSSLVVKLYDNTAANQTGTIIPNMGTTVIPATTPGTTGTYVLYLNGAVYTPGTDYSFLVGDLGKKTLTVAYSYTPTGHTAGISVYADVTICVQKNILTSLTATGPTQKDYYEGETLNLAGLAVTATYSNMTDAVDLTSSDYVVTASSDAVVTSTSKVVSATEPLTTDQKYIIITRTETYDGAADDEKTNPVSTAIPIGGTAGVLPAATSLALTPDVLNLDINTTGVFSAVVAPENYSLVVSVDKPAVASVVAGTPSTAGGFTTTPYTIKGLSVGQAIVTIRTRGNLPDASPISKTVVVNVTKPVTTVKSITLDKASLTLAVNGTYSLLATIGPDDATDKTVTWTSSNSNLVYVDSTGTVKVIKDYSTDITSTGVLSDANGSYVTITAETSNGLTSECKIYVNAVAVDGISLSDTSLTLYKGSWKTVTAIVTPTGAADPAVTWTTSNDKVATVDKVGKITAVGIPTDATYGEAIITAQTSNSTVKATVTVKVLPAVLITSLTLNKSELALNVGDEETLTVTGTPSTATNKTLAWTSSNTDVATVNSSGKIIAAGKGSAVIKASATDGSGKYVSCVVTVSNIQVLNVSLDKSSLDLSEGDTATITATIYPTNATNKTLKWTSSNTAVATVDSKGNITAGATKGYAIITAAATDGSGKSAECVVLSKPKIAVTGITINYGTALDIMLGDSTYLKGAILPANATTQTVTWATSNSAVATIDSTGLLKGVALGEATITATADNKTASITITVTNTEYNYGVAANFRRRVNVRASASGLSKLVGYAYVGDTFKILGKTGSWYYIQYNNTTKGYIWTSYLNASKTSAAYTSAGTTTTTGTGTTTTTTSGTVTTVTIANCLYAVNVRTSASTTSTRLGKATLGSSYKYLATEGDWYKIQYNTTTVGYVYKTFATLS